MNTKKEKRINRHKKIRSRIHGTEERPRLFVFRSNQHIYAQLINDDKAKILISVSDLDLKEKKPASAKGSGGAKSDMAKEVGMLIAKKAAEAKIVKVVFDRGGFIFHGRVKALADGAKEGGLQF